MTDQKILITGGNGFIGKHLVNLLLRSGFSNLTIVDTQDNGIDGLKYVKADFAEELVMAPLLKHCNAVFHLAAMIGVDNCHTQPEVVKQVNLENTKRFFDIAVASGVKKIVFTSSSEVYGNSQDIPYREDGNLEPVSVYGESKVEIEKYLHMLQKNKGVSVGISRLFNVYGPGQKKDFVVSIFINAAINNKQLQVLGDGQQTRTFTFVEDVVDGLLKIFNYSKTPYEIFNLGGQKESTITELAHEVLLCIPESSSKIEYLPYGQDGIRSSHYEIRRRVPSTEKSKNILSFVANTSLHSGLLKTINSIKITPNLH